MNSFDIDPKVNEQVKKKLLWFGIFSIIMIFAGLTSAYIVSKGSNFWVQFEKPIQFLYSTITAIAGSLCLYFAIKFIKVGKFQLVKLLTALAFISSILFCVFQYSGWIQLSSRGNAVTTSIVNNLGKYGEYYSLSYEGREITFDGYEFYYQGQTLTESLKADMKAFCQKLMDGAHHSNAKHSFDLPDYGSKFTLFYKSQLVTYLNGTIQINGLAPSHEQYDLLHKFAESIVNDRGDFMISGRLGVDFHIHYKGKELTYDNRVFLLGGRPLTAKEESDLYGSENQASEFTFAFVFVHILHVIGGLIALLVIWIRSMQGSYTAENHLGIKLGTIYWHFLGILWIYLYLFLIFIH